MPNEKKTKIVVDTNWWISFLVSKRSSGLPHFLLDESIIICFSEELKNEIYSSMLYARNQNRINHLNFELLIPFLNSVATFYKVRTAIEACRDPKDNFLLALSKDAAADFLITNDKDLLVLEKFDGTVICTLNQFIENHRLQAAE